MVSAAGVLALALIAQAAAPSGPAQPPVEPIRDGVVDTPPACDAPDRAPDPRCDESLDGRDPAQASAARQAARAALAPPRAAARLVMLPLIEATAGAERHSVFPWLKAITTSDDGKV